MHTLHSLGIGKLLSCLFFLPSFTDDADASVHGPPSPIGAIGEAGSEEPPGLPEPQGSLQIPASTGANGGN